MHKPATHTTKRQGCCTNPICVDAMHVTFLKNVCDFKLTSLVSPIFRHLTAGYLADI